MSEVESLQAERGSFLRRAEEAEQGLDNLAAQAREVADRLVVE